MVTHGNGHRKPLPPAAQRELPDHQSRGPALQLHRLGGGHATNWWWPELDVENGYWPTGIAHEVSLSAFVAVFATLGYLPTEGDALEPGWERIALFAIADGTPSHAARQLPNGRWTSKLGKLADIEHELHDLTGTEYGAVVQIMKRPLV